MSHKIQTTITIKATSEQVWKVLTNFKDYPDWNPFLTEASGKLKVGEKLLINAGGMKFKPTLLKVEKNVELRWLGKLLFSGIFDGEHYFQIEENSDGTITFHHGEIFKGILVSMFKKKLDTETKASFKEMNMALKKRCENLKTEN